MRDSTQAVACTTLLIFRISRDCYAVGLYENCNHLKYEQRIDFMIYEHLRIL